MWTTIKRFFNITALRDLFDLHGDEANRFEVIQEVRKNVPFRGTNLWVLIFAIMICSVGLNVNSTAVIIGAMLISPLMGPIIGLGMGVGIFDVKLMRRAGKNILIAVIISVLTSALYFALSPLSDPNTELLSRTRPTLWDVVIGLFGGLSGIIAATREEKTNVVPGVAIATALMPPLCTAGYGLAHLNMQFLFGALYLFCINTVFIAFAAWLIVRFLNFPTFEFVDAIRERKVRVIVTSVILLTTLPSIWYAYTLVDQTIFERNAKAFVQQEFNFPNTMVIDKQIDPSRKAREVVVSLVGERLDTATIAQLNALLAEYEIPDARLNIRQGGKDEVNFDVGKLRTEVFQDMYLKNMEQLQQRDHTIEELENKLTRHIEDSLPAASMARELAAFEPSITQFSVSRASLIDTRSSACDSATVAVLSFDRRVSSKDLDRIQKWLKARAGGDSVVVVVR